MEKSTSIPHPIGDNVPRVDAHEKVLGAALFADDLQFGPGLLYARIKRSPVPHALIKNIDTSKALTLPGVKAVVAGQDFPGLIGLYLKDRHIFCRERVRYVGDPVAGVAAVSEAIAEQALDLIEVEYEPLPGVFDPEFGASASAPLLHPELGSYAVANFIFPEPGSNVSNHFRIRKGDVDTAWENCAAIVEHKYNIPHIQHVPIEPHVAVAKVDEKGRVTLWGSSQSPFAQRSLIASSLGISTSDVQVIAPYVGGGFGCKAGVSMEALAVAIAWKLRGRPVKLRLTREEEFYTAFTPNMASTSPAPPVTAAVVHIMSRTLKPIASASIPITRSAARCAGLACPKCMLAWSSVSMSLRQPSTWIRCSSAGSTVSKPGIRWSPG